VLERGAHLPSAELADARAAAATLAFALGEWARVRALREENLALYEELGDALNVARMKHELGSTYLMEQDYERAAELYDSSIDYFRAEGHTLRLGIALANRAETALAAGDYAACRTLAAEALELQARWDDSESTAITLQTLARAALHEGRRDEARQALGRACELALEIGHREALAYCFEGVAELGLDDSPAEAATLLGAAEALLEQIGAVVQAHQRQAFEHVGAELATRLGADELEARRLEGRGLPVEEAAALALAER
jgi:tetratricopeptide (TPR) repeat protein